MNETHEFVSLKLFILEIYNTVSVCVCFYDFDFYVIDLQKDEKKLKFQIFSQYLKKSHSQWNKNRKNNNWEKSHLKILL